LCEFLYGLFIGFLAIYTPFVPVTNFEKNCRFMKMMSSLVRNHAKST